MEKTGFPCLQLSHLQFFYYQNFFRQFNKIETENKESNSNIRFLPPLNYILYHYIIFLLQRICIPNIHRVLLIF